MNLNDVYVRVTHNGTLSRSSRMTLQEAHEANFIVVKKDGDLVIWKDRYGKSGVVVTEREADARARDHVEVALGHKKASTVYRF